MKKLSTLFKKDPNDLGRVIDIINFENKWVYDIGYPTRKFDGSACSIINGELHKRYDVKKGKQVPENAIPCQDPDEITGHWPHWVKCDRNNPADKWFFVGFDGMDIVADGTYELCGEKVQSNPEGFKGHVLVLHGVEILPLYEFSFESIKEYLSNPENDIEGIVFHNKYDDRMCKIRKSDFGIKR